jgi:hypothetical protein
MISSPPSSYSARHFTHIAFDDFRVFRDNLSVVTT